MNDLKKFEDSGIRDVQFINHGKDLLIRFVSSYDGSHIGSLQCVDIITFKYSDPDREYTDGGSPEISHGFFGEFFCEINVEKISDYYRITFDPFDNILIECLSYETLD